MGLVDGAEQDPESWQTAWPLRAAAPPVLASSPSRFPPPRSDLPPSPCSTGPTISVPSSRRSNSSAPPSPPSSSRPPPKPLRKICNLIYYKFPTLSAVRQRPPIIPDRGPALRLCVLQRTSHKPALGDGGTLPTTTYSQPASANLSSSWLKCCISFRRRLPRFQHQGQRFLVQPPALLDRQREVVLRQIKVDAGARPQRPGRDCLLEYWGFPNLRKARFP